MLRPQYPILDCRQLDYAGAGVYAIVALARSTTSAMMMGFEECGLLGAALLRKTALARPTDISRARTTAASLARVRLTVSVSWPLGSRTRHMPGQSLSGSMLARIRLP